MATLVRTANESLTWRSVKTVPPEPAQVNATATETPGLSDASYALPFIKNVVESNITTTGITIAWNVSPPATGRIEYGTTESYGSFSTLEPTLLGFHSQILTGLSVGTLYHYRILGVGGAGQSVATADDTFTTAGGSVVGRNVSDPFSWSDAATTGLIIYTDYTYTSGSIQTFLNSIPSGTDDSHWSRGIFSPTAQLTLANGGRLTINGKHHIELIGCDPAIITAGAAVSQSTPRCRITAQGTGDDTGDSVFGIGDSITSHHISIFGFEMVGTLTTGATSGAYVSAKESQHGVTVWGPGGTHDIRIAYNYIRDMGGHSAYLRANAGAELTDVSFDHNYVLRMGTMGVAIVNGVNGTCSDNFIIDTGLFPIDFENDAEAATNELHDWDVSRNTIDRWTWSNNANNQGNMAIVCYNHWGMLSTMRNFTLDGNILRGGKQNGGTGSGFGSLIDFGESGFGADPKQNITISNTDSNVSRSNIAVKNCAGVTITNNVMAGTLIAALTSCTGTITVTGNTPSAYTSV